MKNLNLTVFASILAIISMAQTIDTANYPIWIEMMQDPNANFFETQRAFEIYWDGRERQPGDGWKVFKRWENHVAARVNEDGSIPQPGEVADAFNQARIAFNQNQSGSESLNGDWVEIGPIAKPNNGTGQPNGNGRLITICFHPTTATTFWVGAPAGGLWKTTDGGASWTSNTDNLPTLGVSSMLVDPTNTNVLYIGTGDRDAGDAPGLGVYKSTDGGSTWFVSNSGMGNKTVGAMLMHPSNSSILLAATSGGIYRSTNSGSSWTLVSAGDNFKDIKFKPGDPNTVYATETSSAAGFYKSTNNGISWTQITSGLPTSPQRYVIGVTPANSSVVYLLTSISSQFEGLYKSTDSGNSFTQQSNSPNLLGWNESGNDAGGQGWYDLAIAVDPTNANVVYTGGVNIWKSTNSGVNWDCVAHWVGSSTAASVHADQHWFAYSPLNGNLYACNDGGIYVTSDGGNTWPELSSGLGISQLYKLGVSQQTNELVINGYQDNGTAIWDDTIFRTERGGDGMECIIDHSNDDVMYASVYYGNIARSLNNGYGFGGFAANGTNGITESGAWVTPYILDKDNSNIMFIGYKNVWRTESAKSATVSFDPISNSLAGSNSSNMRQLRQGKVNGNRLFAIRSDNKFFRSDNALSASPSWIDLSSSLPGSGTLRDVETSPFNNNTLWIARGNKVWKSTNGGSSWTDITGSLPNIAALTICADPLSDGGLYVGMDGGIYYIDNSLTNWITFDDNFPVNVSVEELEIYHPQGNWLASRIRAATYGRGLWESDLYYPLNIAPLAFIGLSANETDLCDPDTISLYNNSAYGVSTSSWTITPSTGVTFVGGTSSVSMNPKIVITNSGQYNVKLVVTNGNGADSLTIQNAINVSGGLPFPWYDNFESNIQCGTGGCVTNCDINNWINAENGVDDDVDWRVDAGGTPSGGTGPSVDYDPGTDSTNYIYIEGSSCFNQVALLESPCLLVDNVTNPKFKFGYHMYGSNMKDLKVEVLTSGSWSTLWNQTGTNMGDQWNPVSISLNSYIGQSIKVRFRGETGTNYQSDVALDGIEFVAAPKADFYANDTTPCIGQIVIINDVSSQSPTSWLWTINPNTFTYANGTSNTSQHPHINFTANGSYTVQLKATNSYGNNTKSKLFYMTVNDPVFSIDPNKTNAEYCIEDSVLLAVNYPGIDYKFYRNAVLSQFGSSNSTYYPNWETGDYVTVILTDSNGCVGVSDTLLLTKLPPAQGEMTSSDDDNTICDGDEVTFTVVGTNLSNYDFLLNGNSVQNDSSNAWTTTSLVSGDDVWADLISDAGCVGISDTISTTVLPIPLPPGIAVIIDSLQCTVVADLYMWTVDSIVQPDSGQSIAKQGDGYYRVRISQDGCWSDWSDPLIITDINDVANAQIRVFPSPTRDIINIEYDGKTVSLSNINLYDMNGRLVKTYNDQSKNRTTLNVAELPTGVYTLVMTMGGENFAIPIVKE
ncbi:MAG: T9SS type A sorting domain-containing protein [Flavobacteriales bacterium]